MLTLRCQRAALLQLSLEPAVRLGRSGHIDLTGSTLSKGMPVDKACCTEK